MNVTMQVREVGGEAVEVFYSGRIDTMDERNQRTDAVVVDAFVGTENVGRVIVEDALLFSPFEQDLSIMYPLGRMTWRSTQGEHEAINALLGDTGEGGKDEEAE